jgi:glyoxylate carboligase
MTPTKAQDNHQGKMMTGAEIFVRCLVEEGVDTLFGYPGGVVIGIYDVLHDLTHIKHILTPRKDIPKRPANPELYW